MFSEIFEDFFKEANKIMEELSEDKCYCGKKCNKNNKKEEPTSYYHFVSDKYENGEHVSHKEKEVKDGEVTKNVDETFKIEDKNDSKKSETKSVEDKIDWKKAYENTKKEISELYKTNDALRKENSKLKQENDKLTCVLEKIKSIF